MKGKRADWAASSRSRLDRKALDAWRFSSKRADYYDYLSAVLHGMQGSRTLKHIFALDAHRYGPRSARGRLSLAWLNTYQAAGGDLYSTWMNSFPTDELVLIRTAQSFGNTVLIQTLQELADVARLMKQAQDILIATLWAAGCAIVLLALMVIAVPFFTIPRLLATFDVVPVEYYGSLTRKLVGFAEYVHAHWLFLMVAVIGTCWIAVWSLPNTAGSTRHYLDRFGLWRIYRHVQALRFLSLLAVILGRAEARPTQLRIALASMRTGASKWQGSHVQSMLERIDAGITGANTFDTGLLDREMLWFLADMVVARGLHAGLALCCARLRCQVLGAVARQAATWRWLLLLFCLCGLLGLGGWHYAVIDELRHSLMLLYASQ
jgi:hypothetical protein